MAAFATIADLADYLEVTIDPGDPRATLLLDNASAVIRGYTRQLIDQVDGDTITVHGYGRKIILLPELPVRDVTAVSVDGTALDADDYSWDSLGILRRVDAPTWGTTEPVVITYDHGFLTTPEELKAICLKLAAKVWTNPDGMLSESIGSYSVTYSGSREGSQILADAERAALDAFRYRSIV